MILLNIKKHLKLDPQSIKEVDAAIELINLKGVLTLEDFVYQLNRFLPMALSTLSEIIKKTQKETIKKIKNHEISSDILPKVFENYKL